MKWIWYDIEEYPNYKVSDYGEVINMNTMRILKKDRRKGYYSVRLSKGGASKVFSVHRLVASAFLGNPYNLPQVNHKDGNRENNHVDNLEWVTQEDNLKHQQENNLCPKGEENGNSKLTTAEVVSIIKLNDGIHISKEVAEMYGCTMDNIRSIWNCKTWKHIPR
ncbi:major capsid protein [Bacillus phage BC-6]|nr:major capsid protein [Bacillus phage BC-6]